MGEEKALLRRFHEMVAAGAFADWSDVLAEDFVFRMPYAPPGVPRELCGLAVRDALAASRAGQEWFRWQDVTIRATEEAGLFLTTARSEVLMKTGRPYANSYVMLTRIREGRIVEHTEYFDPLPVLETLAG